MNAELTFSQPSENFFQPNVGYISFMAINNSLTRMVVTTDGYDQRYGQIYYFTRPSESDAWSAKIQIMGIPVTGMRWTCASMSADGSRLVVIGYSIPPYTFRWVGGAYVFQGTISNPSLANHSYAGLNMTSDGSRIVISTIAGYSYYATWNSSTNNYNPLIKTLDDTPRNLSNNQYANLGMSSNGNRIAFCSYNQQNVPSFIFADWNGSNYDPYTTITALNGNLNLCSGGALSPDGGCLLVNAQQPMYGYFNSGIGNFTGFVNIPSSIMPPLIGLYYINIFTITHDGLHLFWNLNREDQTIKKIAISYSTPALYLGDKVTVRKLDVNFNDANVFVKDPTVGLHIATKQYVDAKVSATHALISTIESMETTSTTEYNDLIAERQLVQSDLATQINNLYQYFFNNSRTETVLFEPAFLNPLLIDGCCLWMDAADSSVIFKSGTSISGWNDKSGRGYNFIQTNPGQMPTYSTNALNDKSVISFTSTLQTYLGGPTGFEIGRNSYALFVVCKLDSAGGVFNRAKYGGAPDRIIMFGNYSAGLMHANMNETIRSYESIGGEYVIFEFIVNRVQGNDAIFVNGIKTIEQSYTPDINVYSGAGEFNMIIGGYNNSTGGIDPPQPGLYLDGDIAEIVAYANPIDLTNEHRQKVEGYLASKWGLTSKLPGNHPINNVSSRSSIL